MKVIHLEQNSQEWLNFRKHKIGASDAPIIMDESPHKGPRALWREKMLNEQTFMTSAMRYGQEQEPLLLQQYNEKFGHSFKPEVGQHDKMDYMIASFDGYDDCANFTLEIKTTNVGNWEAYQKDFPLHWKIQALHQLEVSRKSYVEFYVACREMDIEPFRVQIFRDDAVIKKMLEQEKEFYRCMMEMKEPKCGINEKEYVEREDNIWEQIAEDFQKGKAIELEGKRLQEEAKKRAIDASFGIPSKGFGITLCIAKGRKQIAYKKLVEEHGLDAAPFTTFSEPTWQVRTYSF